MTRSARSKRAYVDHVMCCVYRRMALRAQGFRCAYCLCPLSFKTVTADHVVARLHGGKTVAENIKAACFRCNFVKNTMKHFAFLEAIAAAMPFGDPAFYEIASDHRLWETTWKSCERIAAQVGIDATSILPEIDFNARAI